MRGIRRIGWLVDYYENIYFGIAGVGNVEMEMAVSRAAHNRFRL